MADVTPATLLGATDEPNLALYNQIHQNALTLIQEKYTGKLDTHPTVNYLQVFVEVGRPSIADVWIQQNEQAMAYRRLAQMMDDEMIAAGWLSATTEVKNLKYQANSMILQYDIELIAVP